MDGLTPEAEDKIARAMRDAVYITPTSDTNWAACQMSWLNTLATFRNSLFAAGYAITPLKNDNPAHP